MSRPKLELADIFRTHGPAWRWANAGHVSLSQLKVMSAIEACRTAARDWMAARTEDLLPVEYFHVAFILPAEIARIAYTNKKEVYGLLFRASAETLMAIAADPKRLGARIGMISVLHIWGSALTRHPHVHMIVPDGATKPPFAAGDRSVWRVPRRRRCLHVYYQNSGSFEISLERGSTGISGERKCRPFNPHPLPCGGGCQLLASEAEDCTPSRR